MNTVFDIVSEDFSKDLSAISELLAAVQMNRSSAKARVAAVNSTTLLLAATFEEFVREMGRQYAREIVARTDNMDDLPRQLIATAWRRTLEGLARAKIDNGGTLQTYEQITRDAKSQFGKICGFIEGDTSQDVYSSLMHNENNMRPTQLNAIFKVCNLSDVCLKFSDKAPLLQYFNETDSGKVHGFFVIKLNDFFEKRNEIAHSLNPGSSISSETLQDEVKFFACVAQSLAETLPQHLPTPVVAHHINHSKN